MFRAVSRDFYSYLIESNPQASAAIDEALWQPIEHEEGLLEFMIFKVSHRPDGESRSFSNEHPPELLMPIDASSRILHAHVEFYFPIS